MKICYVKKNFRDETLAVIRDADTIIKEFAAEGYDLTVRQLYYQFIGRNLFPESWIQEWPRKSGVFTKNCLPNYKRLARIVNSARLAGQLSWEAIVDRTRNLETNNHWDDPAHLLEWAAEGYGFDLWRYQDERVEIWVEKEAMAGVVQRPADEWDVPWFCCRGYTSSSELWQAAQRFKGYAAQEQPVTIIYLGDHDPSGLNIDPVIEETIATFGEEVKVERIALHMAQVHEFNLPPDPAKMTDSRAKGYVEEYGDEAWELDALDIRFLNGIINDAIRAHCDQGRLKLARIQQEEERDQIRVLADSFSG